MTPAGGRQTRPQSSACGSSYPAALRAAQPAPAKDGRGYHCETLAPDGDHRPQLGDAPPRHRCRTPGPCDRRLTGTAARSRRHRPCQGHRRTHDP